MEEPRQLADIEQGGRGRMTTRAEAWAGQQRGGCGQPPGRKLAANQRREGRMRTSTWEVKCGTRSTCERSRKEESDLADSTNSFFQNQLRQNKRRSRNELQQPTIK
jgi:hypothetical protein